MKLTVEDVRFAYKGGGNVLNGVSLELFQGGITALLGSNGTGKSTLLKIIAGLLRPDSGRVDADGCEVSRLSPRRRAEMIGVISQSAAVPADCTVEDAVIMGAYHRLPRFGALPPEERKLLEDVLSAAGIETLRKRLCSQLSGGELQLAMAAQTMMQVPEGGVLLADEPVSMLDPARRKNFALLLKKAAEKHSGLLLTTHDPFFAAKYADRVLLMKAGRIVKSGPPAHILTKENLTEIYGVAPETTDFPVY